MSKRDKTLEKAMETSSSIFQESTAGQQFARLSGWALILLALTGPLAYCTAETRKSKDELIATCINAGGTWIVNVCRRED